MSNSLCLIIRDVISILGIIPFNWLSRRRQCRRQIFACGKKKILSYRAWKTRQECENMRTVITNCANFLPRVRRNTTNMPSNLKEWTVDTQKTPKSMCTRHTFLQWHTQTPVFTQVDAAGSRRWTHTVDPSETRCWSPPHPALTKTCHFLFFLLTSIFQFVRPHWDQERKCKEWGESTHTCVYGEGQAAWGQDWRSAHCRQSHAAFMIDG